MNLKIKLNLNLNSQVHCKFDLKSEISYQIAKFLHLQIEKQWCFLKNSGVFILKLKKKHKALLCSIL